jgi:NADPH:quinone reductase-like Zn-dependent oxidoreductase
MKMLQHSRFGEPDEVLELLEQDLPPPAPHEARVRVEAASLHIGDLKNIAGEKIMVRNVKSGDDLHVDLPQVPGIEGVGRITAIGADVKDFAIGDRVLLPWQCGSWREELNADAERLHHAPEGDAVQLALMINAFTAEFALRDLAPLAPGDWFVQNAANSNVCRIIVQLAKARGIRTANIVRRESARDELLALGADVVLLEGPDLPARLRAATGGAKLMVGLDSIAGEATGLLAECLSDGATVANMGLMSGEPCSIPSWILLYKRTKIVGHYAGYNIAARTRDEQREIIGELARLIGNGTLVTKIAATYRLSEYKEAVRHAARGGSDRDGKVVFVMDGA